MDMKINDTIYSFHFYYCFLFGSFTEIWYRELA